MEVFEGAEEMVAGAAGHRAGVVGDPDHFGEQLCSGTLYLHIILAMTRRKQIESLGAVLLLFLLIGRWQRNWYYVYAGTALFLLGLVWRQAGALIASGWMGLGKAIGFVTGKVLLTLVFVFILLPISIFARRRDRLDIRLKPGQRTNFKERVHTFGKTDLENPW